MKNNIQNIIDLAQEIQQETGNSFRDSLSENMYKKAQEISEETISISGKFQKLNWDTRIDKIVTSRKFGFPIMLILLSVLLWITIVGANYPSALLNTLLVENGHSFLKNSFLEIGVNKWWTGFLIDGIYLATAWVVAVMLPPMAIFFPLFSLLEDFGYLPRIAFNMDGLFQKTGAHGKQALTMAMGFGCNATGVIATRIIDSPRERLIAILTNNFSVCNGRWGMQILLSTLFLGALVPAHFSGLISILGVIGICLLGILFMFLASFLFSKTLLKGKSSSFYLELPPYRLPNFWQTLYTSLIHRTLVVLWRAVVFAAPAGAVIWLISNIYIEENTLAVWLISFFNDFGLFFGLNGIIILAYIIAIPANEIVLPTILMLSVLAFGIQGITTENGVLFELESHQQIRHILTTSGWTTLTAINVMIFSLLHNPCSTTIYTIYKETKSVKWTIIATIFPILLGLLVTFCITWSYKIFF